MSQQERLLAYHFSYLTIGDHELLLSGKSPLR